MQIRKILNNNCIVSTNEKGNVVIVTARGIGWKNREGAVIDNRKYPDIKIFMLDNAELQQIRAVYESIPDEIFSFSDDLIREKVGSDAKVNFTSVLMLADHINASIKRLRNGYKIKNVLLNDIKTFYPKEFALAHKAKNLA